MAIEDDITILLERASELETCAVQKSMFAQAAVAYEEAATLAEHHWGPYTENTLKIRDKWASALREAGKLEAAITCNRINIERYKNSRSHGSRHELTLDAQRRLAESCVQSSRHQEAIQVYRAVVDIMSKPNMGIERLCKDRSELAKALFEEGLESKEPRYIFEAVDVNTKTLPMAKEYLGDDHIESVWTRYNLGTELYELTKYQDAVKYLEETQEILMRPECKCKDHSDYAELLEETEQSLKVCRNKIRKEGKRKREQREAKAKEERDRAEAERKNKALAEEMRKIEAERARNEAERKEVERKEAERKELELAEQRRAEQERLQALAAAERLKEDERQKRKREEQERELARLAEQKREEQRQEIARLEEQKRKEQARELARLEKEHAEELQREEEKRRKKLADEQKLKDKQAKEERIRQESVEKEKSRERRRVKLAEAERIAKLEEEQRLQQEKIQKEKIQQEALAKDKAELERAEEANYAALSGEERTAKEEVTELTDETPRGRTRKENSVREGVGKTNRAEGESSKRHQGDAAPLPMAAPKEVVRSGETLEINDHSRGSAPVNQMNQSIGSATDERAVQEPSQFPTSPTSPSTSIIGQTVTQGLMNGFRVVSNATSKAAEFGLLSVAGYTRRTRSRSVGDVSPIPSSRAESPAPEKNTQSPSQEEATVGQTKREHRRSLQMLQPAPLFKLSRTDSAGRSFIPGGWQHDFDEGERELRKVHSSSNIFNSGASRNETSPSLAAPTQVPSPYVPPRAQRSREERQADEWFTDLEHHVHTCLDAYSDYTDRSVKLRSVKIAVLDTGVAKRSNPATPVPHLIQERSRRLKFVKFGKRDHVSWRPEEDIKGHGTHAAGLILTVCPYAEVYVYRVLEGEEHISHSVVTEALTDAIDKRKVDIVSMSFGWDRNEDAGLRAVIDRAKSSKVLLFAASSNHGNRRGGMVYPARAAEVIAVDAADGDGSPSKFNPPENHKPRFTALGEDVRSAWPTALAEIGDEIGWKRTSGTSCATPIAAAIAGLVLEFARQPPLCHDPRIEEHLKSLEGMQTILSKLLSQRGTTFTSYQNLLPQLLFSRNERYPDGGKWYQSSSPRGIAASSVIACLQREYGHDIGEPIDAKWNAVFEGH